MHAIGAIWPGDTTFAPVTLVGTHSVTVIPTTTSLFSSSNPSNAGSQITLTATVSSTGGTPAGSITFSDGGSFFAGVPLSAGVAQYTTSTLAVGTHPITASYAANGNFAASNASLSQVVNGTPSAAAISAAPNPAYVAQNVTISGSVTSASGTPSGTLAFYDGTTLLGTVALSVRGKASLLTAFTSAGTHNLTLQYSGDAVFNAAVSPIFAENVLINPTAISMTASPNPGVAFSAIGFSATVTSSTGLVPDGTVVFSANGNQIGTAVLQSGHVSLTTSALAGTYNVSAAYAGNATFAAANSAPITLVVAQAPSQTILASSLNPAPAGISITFTATTTAGSIAPSGSLQFFDGTTAMGSPVVLNAQGIAAYTTTNLSLGTHPITAVFAGNHDLLANTSAVLQQAIDPYIGDFTITVKPGAASITQGDSATIQVVVNSVNGFNGPLVPACTGIPANTIYTLSPGSFSAGQGTATLAIKTTAPKLNSANKTDPGPAGLHRASPIIFAAFLVASFAPRRFRRRLLCLGLLAFCAAIGMNGCGGGSLLSASGGTPQGTYDIQISATYSSATPALQHSADLILSVKPM